MAYQRRPLWRCPKCGERFISKNMWHSCGKQNLNALFARSEPQVFRLFLKFMEIVERCGPVRVIPQKTRVVFQVRTRFAGAVPRKSFLRIGFILARKIDDGRFIKIESFPPRLHAHYIILDAEEQFDEEFKSWISEAYLVGDQRHLE